MRPAEVAQREKIGVSQIMWGQDYPHPEATFPWSREALRHTFSDVDPAEVLAMVSTNACRVFGFDATTLGQVADEIGAPTVEEVRTPLDKIPDGATCPAFADADSARAW